MNNTVTIDNVPEGFECTGEYRFVNTGEYYFDDFEAVRHRTQKPSCARYPILREIWHPPAWIPKGAWLYRGWLSLGWLITDQEPVQKVNGYYQSRGKGVSACDLAALHGDTFTPPTHTNCLQIQ